MVIRMIALALAPIPLVAIPLVAIALAPVPLNAQESLEEPSELSVKRIDSLMFLDPEFHYPRPTIVIPNDPKALWIQALSRPDAQLQRVAIDTLTLAHRRGMKGLEETIPMLVQLLSDPELDVEVQRAAVSALIEFDAHDQAEMLATFSRSHSLAIASLIEPALMRWKSTVMVDSWLDSLNRPGVGRQSLIHAIDGLGALKYAKASEPLSNLVFDDSLPTNIRMAAATSLASIHPNGLSERAADLILSSNAGPAIDLMALALLDQEVGPEAISLMRQLARRENTAVQGAALGRLYEIDPRLVDEFADDALLSRDVNVRRWALRAMHSKRAVGSIAPVSRLLDDVNPTLRGDAAETLVDLASHDELRTEVISRTTEVLKSDAWRGCEQATVVLVNLDYKPAGKRLVTLLDHPRSEVMVASAWGLRELMLEEHLPSMLDKAKSIYNGFRDGRLNASMRGPDEQIAQLFMGFGRMGYLDAEELMRSYMPKDFTLGVNSRLAAAWAIGYLHENRPTEELTSLFIGRVNDLGGLEPEREDMRMMSIVSLGRIKSADAMPRIRELAQSNQGVFGQACDWAIERVTGETPPVITPAEVTYKGWFLLPAEEPSPAQ